MKMRFLVCAESSKPLYSGFYKTCGHKVRVQADYFLVFALVWVLNLVVLEFKSLHMIMLNTVMLNKRLISCLCELFEHIYEMGFESVLLIR